MFCGIGKRTPVPRTPIWYFLKSCRILTTELNDPTGYGRIVRNDAGDVICITEQKDADQATLAIKEVNSGIMVLPAQW